MSASSAKNLRRIGGSKLSQLLLATRPTAAAFWTELNDQLGHTNMADRPRFTCPRCGRNNFSSQGYVIQHQQRSRCCNEVAQENLHQLGQQQNAPQPPNNNQRANNADPEDEIIMVAEDISSESEAEIIDQQDDNSWGIDDWEITNSDLDKVDYDKTLAAVKDHVRQIRDHAIPFDSDEIAAAEPNQQSGRTRCPAELRIRTE